ncbi:MAG: tRNA epoxyqueuosine(34) reductase QueG [Myxococcales bacterium]|nr:tRNA epoxyqueuosine(34) reductase QueG [Myxococcales bacterium]MCB9736213.1 tRNA epoxyqueuosine(34) reductase QueG [Deltaproteobacteria bacterium]
MGATPEERAARVKHHAREVGFDLCGVAPVALPEAFARYADQMAAGYGAEMGWLFERPELREDARRVWPTARSVIALGVSYASDVPGYRAAPPAPDEGWIARYAQGKDYHAHVRKLLIALVQRFEADPLLPGASTDHRIFVDTGPVLEKAYAQAAGVGWIGKNTLLLNRRQGSWTFLAVVLTPLELALDTPGTDHCGSCRRCLDVCPTDAFPAPYVLDARRCIATWTIESAEPAEVIDPEALGSHVFGCDLCQEVCPWNRKVLPTRQAPLRPRPENVRPKLAALAALDEDAFKARFPKSAVRRVDARRMREVVAIVQRRASSPPGEGEESP